MKISNITYSKEAEVESTYTMLKDLNLSNLLTWLQRVGHDWATELNWTY